MTVVLATLGLAELGDIVTTTIALHRGDQEVWMLSVGLVGHLDRWIAFKAATVLCVVAVALLFRRWKVPQWCWSVLRVETLLIALIAVVMVGHNLTVLA